MVARNNQKRQHDTRLFRLYDLVQLEEGKSAYELKMYIARDDETDLMNNLREDAVKQSKKRKSNGSTNK